MPATYKLTLHGAGLTFANEFINVFGYHDQLALPAPITALVDEFQSQVLPLIADILNVTTAFTLIEAEQVIGGTAYYSKVIDPLVRGTRVGGRLPEFNAWGFEYVKAERFKRSGAKRFGLVTEEDQQDGAPVGTVIPLIAACASKLADPITVGIIDTWFPVILERPDPLIPGDPWSYHSISGVRFKNVTSQNTRKK